MTRTDKAIRNAKFTLLSQIITLLAAFVSRRFIANYMFPEYLGLSGLFSNILTVLSLAELGFGTSITYSLYRPLREQNEEKIAALMKLFRKTYIVIGSIVFALGLALTPALGFFVDDIQKVQEAIPDFYLIYVLYVANTSVSYFFSYKRTLLIADQRQYVASLVTSVASFAGCIATCVCIALFKNYVLVMGFTIVFTVLDNVIITLIADRTYGYLKTNKSAVLSNEDSKEIKINVKSTILHNIGGVLVNGTDNILISKFVSFIKEGIYSNYHLVSAAVDSVLRLVIQSITPSYGNLTAGNDDKKKIEVFNHMFFASSWLYGFSSICLFVLIRPFVDLWLGAGFELEATTICLIVFNFYLNGMRRANLLAKDAMGLMRYDRWKSIVEAAINLLTSILLARVMGINGVLLGTSISLLLTCFWVEPYVVFKRGFHCSTGSYFARYVVYTFVSLIALFVTVSICSLVQIGGIMGLFVKLILCLILPNFIYIVMYYKSRELNYYFSLVREKLQKQK